MFKLFVASALIAGTALLAGVGSSEAATSRTVKCRDGVLVIATDSQSNASACSRHGGARIASDGGRDAFASAGGGTAAAVGNPCKPGGSSSGCRDWILGKKKPLIRPK